MNPTTESRLISQVRCDNATAYTAFVTGHLGIVFDLAKRHCNGDGVEMLQELVGEGELALCEAAKNFPRESLSCRFSTYAYLRITRAMVTYRRMEGSVPGVLPESEWAVRLAQKARQNWEALVDFVQREEGKTPTREECAWVYEEKQEINFETPQVLRGEEALDQEAYSVPDDSGGLVFARTKGGGLEARNTAIRPWYTRPDKFPRIMERLPRDTRLLVNRLVEQYEASANVSLSQIASSWHCARQELADTLVPFLVSARGCGSGV